MKRLAIAVLLLSACATPPVPSNAELAKQCKAEGLLPSGVFDGDQFRITGCTGAPIKIEYIVVKADKRAI